jgi:hypothetical protein
MSIPIETTILKIDIKTTGDLITKDYDLIPFHPNMAELRDLSNNNYIFFPAFVKITQKDLQKVGAENDPKVFLNLDKYVELIKYVAGKDPNREKEEDYTLLTHTDERTATIQKVEPLTSDEIITNNIELIKGLFFPPKSHFFILDNDYIIGASNYLPPYVGSSEKNAQIAKETGKVMPLVYTIKIELQLLDAANNPNAGDFSKMACDTKKNNIAKDAKDLFGVTISVAPEMKVAIPSILRTGKATQNRYFGKLQKDWEERNKYQKPPANEAERLAQEKKMTPLQKNMRDLERTQEAYNKIPPLWLKERAALDEKYKAMKTKLLDLWQERGDPTTKETIAPLIEPFIAPDPEKTMEEIRTQADTLPANAGDLKELGEALREYTTLKEELAEKKKATLEASIEQNYENELNALAEKMVNLIKLNVVIDRLLASNTPDIEINKITNDAQRAEKDVIDDTYTASLAEGTGLADKKAELAALNQSEMALYAKKKTAQPYDQALVASDLAKVQGEIRKKGADIKLIEEKFSKTKLISSWEAALKKHRSLTSKIDTEKTRDEKLAANKSVKADLEEKLKKIKEAKKELLLAQFKNGEIEEFDVTTAEKTEFEKKDRPLDSNETLEENLKDLIEEYFELEKRKGGLFDQIDGEVKLLTDDMVRFTNLKDVNTTTKEKLDKKIRDITAEITSLERRTQAAAPGQTTETNVRINALKNESKELTPELNKINEKVKEYNEKSKMYKEYTNALKKMKDTSDLNTKYKDLYNTTAYRAVIKNLDPPAVSQSGGKKTRKKRQHNRRKTKRKMLKKKKQTIRKNRRKKKYTVRR